MRHSLHKRLKVKTKTIPRPLNGGLNNGLTVFDIKDNEMTEQSNVQSLYFPALKPRFPRTNIGTVRTNPKFLDSHGGSVLLTTDTLNLQSVDPSTGTYTTLGSLTVQTDGDATAFAGSTYYANGTDRKAWNGTTLTDVADMPLIDLLETFSGRLYGASSNSDTLYFSAIATPTDWSSANDAGAIDVVTRDDSNCTGLRVFSNHILYFKEHSIHELYGSNPSNYIMQNLTNEMGCINSRAMEEIDGYLYFVSSDGVYRYGGGTAPSKISSPNIDGYVQNMDSDNYSKCVAGYYGNMLYLVLPIGAGEQIFLTYNTTNKLWAVEDDVQFVELHTVNEILYGMKSDGQLIQVVDEDGSEAVQWSTTTKAFDMGSISSDKVIDRIFVTVDIDTASTLEVSLSPDSEGETFTSIGSYTATSGPEVKDIIVPHALKDEAKWHRIRISGTGNSSISNMEIQLRVKPNTY